MRASAIDRLRVSGVDRRRPERHTPRCRCMGSGELLYPEKFGEFAHSDVRVAGECTFETTAIVSKPRRLNTSPVLSTIKWIGRRCVQSELDAASPLEANCTLSLNRRRNRSIGDIAHCFRRCSPVDRVSPTDSDPLVHLERLSVLTEPSLDLDRTVSRLRPNPRFDSTLTTAPLQRQRGVCVSAYSGTEGWETAGFTRYGKSFYQIQRNYGTHRFPVRSPLR